jgi:hypothetical protein
MILPKICFNILTSSLVSSMPPLTRLKVFRLKDILLSCSIRRTTRRVSNTREEEI